MQDNFIRRKIGLWLCLCCAMIFIMVLLGGITRLTKSGLSMVTWKPIRGALPPLSQDAWEHQFSKYKQFPEYKKINRDISLRQFKAIYLMEYFHRLWGRLIGIVLLLPMLYLLFWRKISLGFGLKLFLAFLGGGLQGALGWYMVKSGLVNNPHVSQYRLVAHLFLAVFLYGYLLWLASSCLRPNGSITQVKNERLPRSLWLLSASMTLCVGVMILSGGFVAGLKAGKVYNTFPLMNGSLIPENLFSLRPWYLNFFENVLTVQFTHRIFALSLFIFVVGFILYAQKFPLSKATRKGLFLLGGILFLQVSLGITTLLLYVPVSLAAAHQAGALCLFTVSFVLSYEFYKTSGYRRQPTSNTLA